MGDARSSPCVLQPAGTGSRATSFQDPRPGWFFVLA